MSIDHFPMLFAGLTLLDKVTYGIDIDRALEETCSLCNLNHVQRNTIHRVYLILCSEDCFQQPARPHPGVHWG